MTAVELRSLTLNGGDQLVDAVSDHVRMVLGREVPAGGDPPQLSAEVACKALAVLLLLELVGRAPDDARGDG